MPEPVVPPGARTLEVLPRTPAPPPTEATFARKPPWLKVRASFGPNYRELKGLMRDAELHTVCEEAGCPNIYECWEAREATFLIGGEHCTRACPFCQIHNGRPEGYDTDEPRRVAHAVARMGLRFAVITGVARDDLDDGGAWLFAESVRQVRALLPGCGVEVLIPDFRGRPEPLRQVVDARPDVLGHNVETVPRLYKRIRPGFTYAGSLELLARARSWLPDESATKSNLILGMGEERDEVVATIRDLHAAGVELLTITQYLQPTRQHLNLQRFVPPEEFAELREIAERIGFAHVESGPLVRSSYHAGQMHKAAVQRRRGRLPAWAAGA
ncbi:MAG TPA: lipoyl synthase [Actinomycetes bacterium]|jgi:lipoic acid synthetase|nr:lipoyl synthase [Actinomycetes bacterium]